MIGVICADREKPAVREFFQLFKTPWMFWESSGPVRCPGRHERGRATRIVHRAARDRLRRDRDARRRPAGCLATIAGTRRHARGRRSPIAALHGSTDAGGRRDDAGTIREQRRSADRQARDRLIFLLSGAATIYFPRSSSCSRPDSHANAQVRRPSTSISHSCAGGSSRPGSHCGRSRRRRLVISFSPASRTTWTFLGIRRHRLDRTLAGFLLRASLGSLSGFIRGRRSLRYLLRNWAALLSLPLVYAGVLPDFWLPFDRYIKADGEFRSTFFVIPFPDRPGRGLDGPSDPRRSVKYAARGDKALAPETTVA